HAAAEGRRHGGGRERAAACRGGDRGRGRGHVVQGEADGGGGEAVADLVGRLRLHGVGAVGLRGPGGAGGRGGAGRGGTCRGGGALLAGRLKTAVCKAEPVQ